MGGMVTRVFWDTETTGIQPETGDRIVEIALVEVDASARPTGRRLHHYVNPQGREVGESFNVHGLSDEFLATMAPFSAITDEVLEFMRGATMVAHNSEFDEKFLRAELARLGLEPTWAATEDTLQMARLKHPGEPASLDSLIRRYGIDGQRRGKHGAVVDTELLVEVYAHLVGLTSLSLGSPGRAKGEVAREFMPDGARQFFPYRPPRGISPEEEQRHREFVAVPSSIWASLFVAWDAAAADAAAQGEAAAG